MECVTAPKIEWNSFMRHFVKTVRHDVGVLNEDKLEEELASIFDYDELSVQLYEYAAVALKSAYLEMNIKEGDRNMALLLIELIPVYAEEAPKKLRQFVEIVTSKPPGTKIVYGNVKIKRPLERRAPITVMEALKALTPFMDLGTSVLPYVSVLHEDTIHFTTQHRHEYIMEGDGRINEPIVELRTSKRLLVFITATEEFKDNKNKVVVDEDMQNSIIKVIKSQTDVQLGPLPYIDMCSLTVCNCCSEDSNVLLIPQHFNTIPVVKVSPTMRMAVVIDTMITSGFKTESKYQINNYIRMTPLRLTIDLHDFGSKTTVNYLDFGTA